MASGSDPAKALPSSTERTELTTTPAPSSENLSAVARPMPLVEPVTIATWPDKIPIQRPPPVAGHITARRTGKPLPPSLHSREEGAPGDEATRGLGRGAAGEARCNARRSLLEAAISPGPLLKGTIPYLPARHRLDTWRGWRHRTPRRLVAPRSRGSPPDDRWLSLDGTPLDAIGRIRHHEARGLEPRVRPEGIFNG